jgi:O-antigen biosynthesis protein
VHSCRKILAVNDREAALLKSAGLTGVMRLGTARSPAPTPAPFAAREGLLFVAGIHQEDSPNLDSLRWYIDEILPALVIEMGEAPVLHVVGYAAPDIDLGAFAKHDRIKLHGEAGDLTPFYNAARIFIAPTRYAAGTPYKLYETASFGLPCVATDLLCLQLGWENNKEILSARVNDAEGFARQIARLYGEEKLWNGLREKALARLAGENSFDEFNATVAEVLSTAR